MKLSNDCKSLAAIIKLELLPAPRPRGLASLPALSDRLVGIGEKLLNEQGVKGIRYLDNQSRDAGKGTSNFVVFDPTDVKILERNNQPVEGLLD
jgi:hypothetical protein